MTTKPLWNDPVSLAFLWPPILLAWLLALYHMGKSLEPEVWIVLAVILALIILSAVWLVTERVRAHQSAELPWYLVIGPPGSGKATLVRNTGVAEAPTTVDIVPNADPYFASHSIALEGVGGFVLYREEDLDQPTQAELVAQAATFLQDKPLKGVLVTVDIDAAVSDGALPLAQALRGHIRAITERLGVDVPIYLVVTKCDHLRGFAEFFADLTIQERARGWGATFASAPRGNPGDAFAAECAILHRALDERRLTCLSRGTVAANREAYLFSMELSNACLKLRAFVDALFAPVARERMIFRGFYLTGVARQTASQAQCVYFVADVLTKLIRGDQGLARPTEKAVRHLWWWRLAFLTSAFIAGAALVAPV